MKKTVRLLAVCALMLLPLMLLPGTSIAGERFDGNWQTKLTCPPKGKTDGYTRQFLSVVNAGKFRGERGTAGEAGYLLITGKIAEDGSAKLSATGIVASRQYARGVFTTKGNEYGYDFKAQFKKTEGTGVRNEGLGIVGRACTFEFVKQQATSEAGER